MKTFCRKEKQKKIAEDNVGEENSVTYLNEPWTCSWCSKEFKLSEEKESHIRSHLYTPSVFGWRGNWCICFGQYLI